MKRKLIKASELAMMGYAVNDITVSLMLIFNMHYVEAEKIAIKGSWLASPQENE